MSGSKPVSVNCLALIALFSCLCLSSLPLISCQSVQIQLTVPGPTVVSGVAGAGWLFDVLLTATSAAGNAILSPPAFVPQFNNGIARPLRTGPDAAAAGLVVLFSTTPNNGVNFFGPQTNLAGLFQINANAVSSSGFNKFRAIWFLNAAGFGVGVPITSTIFLLNTTAPQILPTDLTTLSGIVSNIVVTTFNVSGTVSVTTGTSTFNGPSSADPTALTQVTFSPAAGDLVGTLGAGWVIDLFAFASSPQFNPLLSIGAGYNFLFNNGTNPAIFRPGFNVAFPGLVVLLNTTVTAGALQGPSTNLAGLFQMNAIFQVSGPNGFTNGIWPSWQVGAASFGSGPCQLTWFVLNTTAPNTFTGNPQTAPGRISGVATVNFLVSSPSVGTVQGDPSFVGFHGQPSYQVHGIPDEVFNILTAADLQLNSLFTFLDHGAAMTAAQMTQIRRQDALNSKSLPLLPITQAWSHPGTYLTQLALKLGKITLCLQAGPYRTGIRTRLVNPLVSGQSFSLAVGQVINDETDNRLSIRLVDAHRIEVRHSLVTFSIVNSDGFFNLEKAELVGSAAFNELDGLLGQSANPTWKAGSGEEFQQHQMMDYLVEPDELQSSSSSSSSSSSAAAAAAAVAAVQSKLETLFSDNFGANKFVPQQQQQLARAK